MKDISRIDKSGMYDLVKGFAGQMKEGKRIAEGADLSLNLDGIRHVVVVGMGGSAIAGDLLRCFALSEASIPISVVRNYTLPAFVDQHSLVIVSSFSGNTEETISAFGEAVNRKASLVCITSGGMVEQRAAELHLPLVKIPGGISPRAALGYSLSVLLVLADQLKLIALETDAWKEAVHLLEEKTRIYSDPAGEHLALEIAESLVDRLPFIYSASGMLETVSLRWRGQIQENSKKLAAGNVYPELNHNEIMGWELANGRSMHRNLGVVVLRDRQDHVRIQHRMEVTRNLLSDKAGYWVEVDSEGEHPLARMLSLIILGDWVSLYLSYRRDVDPTPIGLIDRLKKELAGV